MSEKINQLFEKYINNNIRDNSYEMSEEEQRQIFEAVARLDSGINRVAKKINGKWQIEASAKQAILLYFKIAKMQRSTNLSHFSKNNQPDLVVTAFDKIPLKFQDWQDEDFIKAGIRVVPSATVRFGAYVAKNCVLMPCFINIGAYVDAGTMIDTFATVGSCAQIGKNVHISGGTGIGGVLEPLQASPVIIEDNCFIGARSEIAEGVIVEQGAVISMGVFISASTKIIDRESNKVYHGRVPAYSVVVPGSVPTKNNLNLSCAVIVKKVDKQTRAKTSVNELLRGL